MKHICQYLVQTLTYSIHFRLFTGSHEHQVEMLVSGQMAGNLTKEQLSLMGDTHCH